MKYLAIVGILAVVAAATPTPTEENAASATASMKYHPTPLPFTIRTSIKDGGSFVYKTVHANGNNFWLKKPTTTFCPDGESCPAGKVTEFQAIAPCALAGKPEPTTVVAVRGPLYLNSYGINFEAQNVFVDTATGAMQFETPDFKAPPGAAKTFELGLSTIRLVPFPGSDRRVGPSACPAGDGSYQIFFGLVKLPKACRQISFFVDPRHAAYRYV